jgi:hypothetical protein
MMSSTYNRETEIAAQIERLELESSDLRRRAAGAIREPDKNILLLQLNELAQEIKGLRERLS